MSSPDRTWVPQQTTREGEPLFGACVDQTTGHGWIAIARAAGIFANPAGDLARKGKNLSVGTG
jgi:hypothetical protein